MAVVRFAWIAIAILCGVLGIIIGSILVKRYDICGDGWKGDMINWGDK